MDCPQCCNDAKNIDLCDNDCGSMECPDCGLEWYVTEAGESGQGHNPRCGEESDADEVADDGNSKAMDLSE